MKKQTPQKICFGAKRGLVVDRGAFTGQPRYSRYGRYGGRLQQQALAARQRINQAHWLAISRGNTLAASAPMTQSLWSAGARSFRQVDAHGKAFGRRYTVKHPAMSWGDQVEVVDRHGQVLNLLTTTRVRLVQPEEETLHSRFSRMLKAEFRRAP